VTEQSALLAGSDVFSTSSVLYLSVDGLLIRQYTQVIYQVFADLMQGVSAVDGELLHCCSCISDHLNNLNNGTVVFQPITLVTRCQKNESYRLAGF